MTEGEVALLLEGLPGVLAVTASSDNGAPEVSWGDSFFFYDPDQTADRRHPFATIVTKDYPGFDTSPKLDRPGVFRLNLAVGRETFRRLFGFRWPGLPLRRRSSTSPSWTVSFRIPSMRGRAGSRS